MPRVPDDYLEARRREILAAAHRRFASHGFRGTRMADIAREAGVSAGSLYRYFQSKEELLHALAEQGREVGRRLRRSVARGSAESPYQQIVDLARRYLEELGPATEPTLRLSVQFWAEALRDPTVAQEVRRSFDELLDVFTGLVTQAQEAGALRRDRTGQEIARAIVALLNEVGLQRALSIELDVAEYLRTIENLLEGLRPERAS